jgi:predicted MFS family arabinose efflux permease
VLGKQRSIAAATNIVVGLAIFGISAILSYRQMYLLVGVLICLIGVWGFSHNPTRTDLVPQRKEMVFRLRYWLFYCLTFMAGARRQIFMAFAVFLLVKKFDYSIREVTLLFVVNNGINYFLSPLIGRSIIRFGERKVLSLEYAGLIVVFVSYALVESRFLAALLYILDHLFFNFSMAIQTYFQKVGDPADIAPSMAVGFTINHIAAVVLPAVGGLLWMIDYRIPFLGGAGMAVVSLVLVQKIRT